MNRTNIHIFVNSFHDTKSKNARLKNDSVLHGRSQEKTDQLFGSSRRTIAQVRSCCSKQQALVSDICLGENLWAIVHNNRSRVTVPAFRQLAIVLILQQLPQSGRSPDGDCSIYSFLPVPSPSSQLENQPATTNSFSPTKIPQAINSALHHLGHHFSTYSPSTCHQSDKRNFNQTSRLRILRPSSLHSRVSFLPSLKHCSKFRHSS